jgi:hypothetical protein
MTITKVQPIVKVKTIITYMNVVDVNVTTRNTATEEQVFKNRKSKKAKSVIN